MSQCWKTPETITVGREAPSLSNARAAAHSAVPWELPLSGDKLHVPGLVTHLLMWTHISVVQHAPCSVSKVCTEKQHSLLTPSVSCQRAQRDGKRKADTRAHGGLQGESAMSHMAGAVRNLGWQLCQSLIHNCTRWDSVSTWMHIFFPLETSQMMLFGNNFFWEDIVNVGSYWYKVGPNLYMNVLYQERNIGTQTQEAGILKTTGIGVGMMCSRTGAHQGWPVMHGVQEGQGIETLLERTAWCHQHLDFGLNAPEPWQNIFVVLCH